LIAGGTNLSCCIYPSCHVIPFAEDFESANFLTNSWVTLSNTESSVGLTLTQSITDTVSLEFSGGNTFWQGGTPYDEAAAFDSTTKLSHFASANICVDLAGPTSPELTFAVAMPGLYSSPYRWLRVMANGTVIADHNGNTAWTNGSGITGNVGQLISATGDTLTFDLTAYAGQSSVNITFQSSCNYGPSNGTSADYVLVDNISIRNLGACTYYSSSATITDVLCNGDATGTAVVISAGGTSPYNEDWNGNISCKWVWLSYFHSIYNLTASSIGNTYRVISLQAISIYCGILICPLIIV
jgi:hypothetical protein